MLISSRTYSSYDWFNQCCKFYLSYMLCKEIRLTLQAGKFIEKRKNSAIDVSKFQGIKCLI